MTAKEIALTVQNEPSIETVKINTFVNDTNLNRT